VINYGYKKEFLDRYDVKEVLHNNRMTKEQIVEDILNIIGN
jgi:1-deoxy-D-xylulose-5-phosphate synthase